MELIAKSRLVTVLTLPNEFVGKVIAPPMADDVAGREKSDIRFR